MWDSGEEDEEEKQDEKVTEEQPSMVGRIHIPRPSFTSSPTHTTNSNGETMRTVTSGSNTVPFVFFCGERAGYIGNSQRAMDQVQISGQNETTKLVSFGHQALQLLVYVIILVALFSKSVIVILSKRLTV